jgi:hypothetical protein
MEGFNPDQSLIPSVGGSITAMSGGGQVGGEALDQTENPQYAIIGMDETQFTKHLSVLKQIAKPVLDGPYNYNEQKGNTNEDIKIAILQNILTYVEDMDILVESDKENAISDANIMNILTKMADKQIDIINDIQFTMNDEGLTIIISPKASGLGSVSSGSTSSPEGYASREEAARAAAEHTLEAAAAGP